MDIIPLNKDVEKYILKTSGITFVHFSDVHARHDLWDRIVEYANHYQDNIDFLLHTGDYCGGSQKVYSDMYSGKKSAKTIYNCIGNHDCYDGGEKWLLSEKSIPYSLLFNHQEEWDANFSDCPYSMSYYKDFDNLRLIVLDDYYHIWETRSWLRELLADALKKNMHVITAQHEPTGYIENTYNSSFQTVDDYNTIFRNYELKRVNYDFDHRCRVLYEDVIKEFISLGGKYVCNLAGHDHVDQFGLTQEGVLNVTVQNATSWDALGDTVRIKGEKSEDCFNVMSIDTKKEYFVLIRVGANTDKHNRVKNIMIFDYLNKKILMEN